jgi:thymidylate kinase
MKRLIIFEGPDGCGKTTLAKAVAARLSAIYVHHGPYKDTTKDLANIYMTSMGPAAIDDSDVVLDRSWLSEKPYGIVFRHGENRLGDAVVSTLESFALVNTNALVVLCCTPWDTCAANFTRNIDNEYLDNTDTLRQVWYWYHQEFTTSLSQLTIDPFSMNQDTAIDRVLECV